MCYVDPQTQAARWVAANPTDGRMPVIRDRIAGVPAGRWFTTTNTSAVREQVEAYTAAAAAQGRIPVLVVYNMPNRDCGGASSGGAPNHAVYRQWIDEIAAGLGGRAATIILEPDVLALMSNCMTARQQADTSASMAYAGKRLKAGSARARVYFDSAHSAWLAPDEMAARLVAAGIADSADGISTNVSNYRTTSDERRDLVCQGRARGDRRVPIARGDRHQPQRQRAAGRGVVRPGGPGDRHGQHRRHRRPDDRRVPLDKTAW
jgi:endoglucanase